MRSRHGVAAVAAVLLSCAALAAVAAPRHAATPGAEHPLDAEDRRPRAETVVAVDPHDPRRVAVVAIQFARAYAEATVSKGYENDDHVWVSADGGTSYRAVGGLPPQRPATPASNDPWLAWDPHGPLYASYTSFSAPLATSNTPEDGLYVARSDDGGRHWKRLAHVEGFDCSGPDRSEIVVDPRRGTVFVAWTHYIEDASCSMTPDISKTVLRWARSTDGGRTFSKPVDVTRDNTGTAIAPAVLPDGTLAVAYLEQATNDVENATCHGFRMPLVVARYSPAGRLLGKSVAIQDLCDSYAGVTPNGAAFLPMLYPAIVADPATGRLVVAVTYQDQVRQGVMTASSGDGGRTWTQALVSGLPGANGDMPALAVGPRGRAALAWLEVDAGGLYRPMLSASTDGGRTWGAATSLATVPSVGNTHPQSPFDGYGKGHYLGVGVGSDGVAHVVWPDLRPDGTGTQDVDLWTRDVALP
jgi:hypothetical protein